MRRARGLFEKVCEFGNLYLGFRKAMRGSGKGEDASRFEFNLEQELLTLQRELAEGAYQPGKYRYFKVYEPKERTISVALFRDRVVHHAVVNVLEPVFEPRFIFDSYATRKEKGTHKAVRRAQEFLRRNRHYLKFDVNKYFDNIAHEILLGLVARKVKDDQLGSLLSVIIGNSDLSRGEMTGKGLPIGNLTSQFFANVYLDVFDHYLKEDLRVKAYLRYMDDCVVFHDDKEYLKDILGKSELFLRERLGLTLKDSATLTNTRLHGLPFLGYRVFPALLRIRSENIKRLKAKIRLRESQFAKGLITEERFSMSLASLVGYAGFADSLGLRRRIFRTA